MLDYSYDQKILRNSSTLIIMYLRKNIHTYMGINLIESSMGFQKQDINIFPVVPYCRNCIN